MNIEYVQDTATNGFWYFVVSPKGSPVELKSSAFADLESCKAAAEKLFTESK